MKPAVRPIASAAAPQTYRLRVTLADIEPLLWRELAVPGQLSLAELHEVIQIAFGWWNGQHHQFILRAGKEDVYAADPVLEIDGGRNSHEILLEQACPRRGATLLYLYDQTDEWLHRIEVLAVDPSRPGAPLAACLDGARNGPMEDCGGAHGHMDLTEALAHPQDADPAMLEWAEDYDPERFDQAEINQVLKAWEAERQAQISKGIQWRRSSLLWELAEIPACHQGPVKR